MEMSLISIVTPVYNSEETIAECINSILKQDCPNWELILVDDGSTDSSANICKEYEQRDTRIHYLYKENGGASSARNLGLENAHGEWVTFIDSDDTIDAHYFDLPFDKGAELLIQRWRFSYHSEPIEPLASGIFEGKDFVRYMSSHAHLDVFRMVAAKFLRNDIIDRNHIRFDEKIRLGEDTVFMQEYYSQINSVSISNSSYYIYYRPENWGGIKYSPSKSECRYFFQKFFQSYYRLSYSSPRLFWFLYKFYGNMLIQRGGIRKRLFVMSIPECVYYRRREMTQHGLLSSIKWLLLRGLSLFNAFL